MQGVSLRKGQDDIMKKLLAVLLTLVLCIPCFSSYGLLSFAEESPYVYMITTNPAEDCSTAMNIGWFTDLGYTKSYVLYTTADDTEFAKASKAVGEYNDQNWKWFENRFIGMSGGERFTKGFLDYGVTLENLMPDTDYIYKIADGKGGYSKVYKFKTAGQTEFSMMWISDYHLTNYEETTKTPRLDGVVDYLETINKYEIGAVFSTGDSVACGDRIGFWQHLYDRPFMNEYMYFATVGNHDLFDNMMKEDFKTDENGRYVFDENGKMVSNFNTFWQSSNYFGITANYPDNGYTTVDPRLTDYLNKNGYSSYAGQPADLPIYVDEGSLAGGMITGNVTNTDGKAYWFIYNRMLFIVIDYYALTYNGNIDDTFNWAGSVIEANKGKYDYLICTEHLNIWWGDSGTSRYYERYKNFLDKYNVDLFFAGDNHIYFRSNSLVGGETNTDPEKGTIFLQAPAITNTSSYSYQTGPAGVGVNKYSAAAYMGGAMIDVDSEGLHFTVAVSTDGNVDTLYNYDTFTIPKKVRYTDKEVGYYKLESDKVIYETTDLESVQLTTIPKDTLVEVYEAKGIWAKIRYNGFSGWTRLTEAPIIAADTVTTYPKLNLTGVNVGYKDGLYAYTPAYGATIANGNWTFAYNAVLTAEAQTDGSYVVTAIDDASGVAKKDTPTEAGKIKLMLPISALSTPEFEALKVGYRFTFDWAQLALNGTDPEETNKEVILPFKVTFVGDNMVLGVDYVLSGGAAEAPEVDLEGKVFVSWDKDFSNITADTVVNAILKNAFETGDANGDGKINAQDATEILKYDVQLVQTLANMEGADTDGDGKIKAADASLVLRYNVQLIKEFPKDKK